jgi:hypothetical protein
MLEVLRQQPFNGAGNTFVLGSYALANSGTSRSGVFNGSGIVTITGVVFEW